MRFGLRLKVVVCAPTLFLLMHQNFSNPSARLSERRNSLQAILILSPHVKNLLIGNLKF